VTATVNTVPGDAAPADDEATATITVVPLQVGVRVTGPASARQGEPFAMRVELSNDSDSDLTATFRGQVSMDLPAGGENLFRWATLPPGCVPDPLSYVCEDPLPLPAGTTRTVVFSFEGLPGSVGRVFTQLARYEPTEGTSVTDSADVRITAAAVVDPPVGPGDGTDQGADTPAPAAEHPATGADTVPLTALGLSLLLVGATLTRFRRRVG
jgi:LPXTG-motif cell wall-anchored protein